MTEYSQSHRSFFDLIWDKSFIADDGSAEPVEKPFAVLDAVRADPAKVTQVATATALIGMMIPFLSVAKSEVIPTRQGWKLADDDAKSCL